MGCGQSKINLYPRRNKGSGKSAHGAKKSGTGDGKDATEDSEEGGGRGPDGDVTGGENETEDGEKGRQLLPLSAGNTIEASVSQQDFFKMLDEKIDKGRDYNSSSETELEIEQNRRTTLIQQWRSASQSSSQFSQSSPPTPSKRRTQQQKSFVKQGSPVGRRCLKSQQSQVSETNSPPTRRCHSAQGNPYNQQEPMIVEKPQIASNRDWQFDVTSNSPVRRPQSAGSNWKGNPKIAPYGLKTAKRNIVDTSDDQRSYSPSQRELQHAYSQDYANNSSRDSSQITYNPTFQSHSPAHVSHKVNPATAVPQQPYITQIVSYPVSQQISSNQYISQTQTYHEQTTNTQRAHNQPNIYYIPQNNLNQTPPPSQEQVQLTQKQQTALHLQQYVAMKQAQQNMFGYFQRNVPTATQDFIQSANQLDPNRTIDITEENYGPTYYTGFQQSRPNSAPNMKPPSVTPIRPVPLNPIQMTPLVGHISPLMGHLSPIITNYGPFPPGQIPQTEVQYYHQSQLLHNMNRPGSAGTLTRYPQKDKQCNTASCNPQPITNAPKNNVCQSINIVRQKSVGQIVSLGGQDLGVYQGSNENNQISNTVPDSNPILIKQQSKESMHSVEHVQTGVNKCMNAAVVNQTYSSEGNTVKQKCLNSEIKVKKGKTDTVKNGRTHNSSLKNCKNIEVAKSNEQDGYL